jgi:hypothetical protein
MKRLISTFAVTAALSFGLWTLAVTFTPIASNFSDGDSVSAAAFNALFGAIEANFNAAKTAIDANEAGVVANAAGIAANEAGIATNTAVIAGLEGNVASAATPPAARVLLQSNQSVNNNQVTTVNWGFEDFDSADMHDNASNNSRITVPEDGIYLISAQVNWTAVDLGDRLLVIYENGNTFPSLSHSDDGPDNTSGVSGVLSLSAGDFVEVKVFQSSGSTVSISSSAQSQFSVVKLGELP